MEINILWGILIGLMVAVPLGPVNIIIIRRALAKGAVSAFTVGLGSALADTIFSAAALLSMGVLTEFLVQTGHIFKIIGGLIVFIVGIKIYRSHPHLSGSTDSALDRFKGAAAVFALTITNPMTILAFLAVFATFGFGSSETYSSENIIQNIYLIIGVFLGCALWWGVLAKIVGIFRHKVNDRLLLFMNRGAGAIVMVFGIYALSSGIFSYF